MEGKKSKTQITMGNKYKGQGFGEKDQSMWLFKCPSVYFTIQSYSHSLIWWMTQNYIYIYFHLQCLNQHNHRFHYSQLVLVPLLYKLPNYLFTLPTKRQMQPKLIFCSHAFEWCLLPLPYSYYHFSSFLLWWLCYCPFPFCLN